MQRLVAVHFRHHDVHQHDAQIGIILDDFNRLPPVRRADDFHLVIFQNRRERKNVSRIVVHHERLAPAQRLVGIVQPREHLLFRFRQTRHDAMQEQRRFVEQTVRRLHVLEHDALGQRSQLLLLLGAQFLPGEHDDRHVAQGRFRLHFFQKRITAHVRQAQIEHAAVELIVHQYLERVRSRADRLNFNVVVLEQFHDAVALHFVVLDDEQPLRARRDKLLDAVEAFIQPFRRRRLDRVGKRAVRKTVLALFLDGNNLNRNVPRRRIKLQIVQNCPAEHVRQENIQRDGRWQKLPRQCDCRVAARGRNRFEALVARKADKNARVMRIIFNDQQDAVARLDQIAVIGNIFFPRRG